MLRHVSLVFELQGERIRSKSGGNVSQKVIHKDFSIYFPKEFLKYALRAVKMVCNEKECLFTIAS